MQFKTHEIRFDPTVDAGAQWLDVMYRDHGLHCRLDPHASQGSTVVGWMLGPVGITRAEFSALALSPVDKADSWQAECIYFKLITSGYVVVEQDGQLHRFDAGSMLALDPAQGFVETVPEQSSLIALRIPKHLLQERGWKPSLGGLIVPDMHPSDTAAIGELIQCIANQSNMPSPDMRNWLGGQLLHLVDVVLAAAKDLSTRRSAEEIIFRAKNYIKQNLGQEDLDASSVGAALNISGKHLQRLFRSQGTSLMRHVWQVRLEHAYALLRANVAGATSVQEIAWQCGFSTAAHFSRVFKQRFGVSPGSVMGISAT
ncbi:AraC family transcriptional regulator [Variovorax sp. GT1P44]|uniref:helix-turn-helix transcriptional regulator n=1 Tax=Variovorax sp. GT1P44 TaxID=3443742 RepID=UPI003F44AE10